MATDALAPIPLSRAFLTGRELEIMQHVLDHLHLAGDGVIGKQCEQLLEQTLGAAKVLLTSSCTHALEMAALLLELKPGDEVIIPSFTFPSTANAVVLRGARPVFADVRPDTLNIDERKLDGLINKRTRAVVAVHYAGVACEMDAITALARGHGIAIVEDNAHGMFGMYRGRPLGTFGCLSALSFHETKNITCGEGGALLINDARLVERAEIIREKGTNRRSFLRGEADKYTWCEVGSSYVPSEILAAVLYAQLEARDTIQERRRRIWMTYARELTGWAQENSVQLPVVPEYCAQAYHLFYMVMPSSAARLDFIRHMAEERITASFHYIPLHSSKAGRKFGGHSSACPVAEDVSARLVRLPFYTGLSEHEQARVVSAVRRFQLHSQATITSCA